MKNKWKKAVIATVTCGCLAMVGCHRHHWKAEKKAEWMQKKISHELDLNNEQEMQLGNIIQKWKEHHRSLHSKQNHQEVINMVAGESIDQKRLNEMLQQRLDHMKEKGPELIAELSELHATLDVEQRQELKEWLEKWRERRYGK